MLVTVDPKTLDRILAELKEISARLDVLELARDEDGEEWKRN